MPGVERYEAVYAATVHSACADCSAAFLSASDLMRDGGSCLTAY